MISDGKEIFLTGYKTIYALTPGQGPGGQRDHPGAEEGEAAREEEVGEEEGLEGAHRDPGSLHPLLGLGDRVGAVVEDRGAEHRIGVPGGDGLDQMVELAGASRGDQEQWDVAAVAGMGRAPRITVARANPARIGTATSAR